MSAISSNPSSSKFSSGIKSEKRLIEENSINDIDIFQYIPNISKPADNAFPWMAHIYDKKAQKYDNK